MLGILASILKAIFMTLILAVILVAILAAVDVRRGRMTHKVDTSPPLIISVKCKNPHDRQMPNLDTLRVKAVMHLNDNLSVIDLPVTVQLYVD